MAKAIIELGERFGTKKDDGLHVNHELTQEELAQLVERCLCTADVSGSSPLISTILISSPK